MLTGTNWALAIVGIVLVGFGVVSSGIVPGLATVGTTPTATLSVQTGNMGPFSVQATLSNSYPTPPQGVAFTSDFQWGDGVGVSHVAPNAMFTHHYSKAGNYTIIDTLNETAFNQSGSNQQILWMEKFVASVTVSIPSNITTPKTGTSAATIVPQFSWKLSGTSLTATDTSQLPTGSSIQSGSFVWSFGDGTTVQGGQGGTVSHTYGQAGSYTVSERYAGTTGGAIYRNYTASQTITVVAPCNPASPGCSSLTSSGTGGATNSPIPSVSFGPIQETAVVAGLVLLFWQFIRVTGPRHLLGIFVSLVLGGLAYGFGSGIL